MPELEMVYMRERQKNVQNISEIRAILLNVR